MRASYYAGLIRPETARWNGSARSVSGKIGDPLHWRKPRVIGVSFMGDLFHQDIHSFDISDIYGVISLCQQHRFLTLTKRAERRDEWYGTELPGFQSSIVADCAVYRGPKTSSDWPGWPLPNVWEGYSAENQRLYDERSSHMIPGCHNWVSLEPLLGPIEFRGVVPEWVVVGCESGPGRRTTQLNWIADIISQCGDARVPCYVEQIDVRCCVSVGSSRTRGHPSYVRRVTSDPADFPPDLRVREMPEGLRIET